MIFAVFQKAQIRVPAGRMGIDPSGLRLCVSFSFLDNRNDFFKKRSHGSRKTCLANGLCLR